MDGKVDAVVCRLRFGRHAHAALSHFFAAHSPQTELVLADPVGSILAEYINDGSSRPSRPAGWSKASARISCRRSAIFARVKKAYAIADKESFLTARELLAKEGILGGSSTGTLLAAALRYCREQTAPKRVVTFVCDTGNKYLSKMYNDYWMLDNGFLEREQHGDLRDLILRAAPSERAVITVVAGGPLLTAYQRMKLYDVSQLPVMEREAGRDRRRVRRAAAVHDDEALPRAGPMRR